MPLKFQRLIDVLDWAVDASVGRCCQLRAYFPCAWLPTPYPSNISSERSQRRISASLLSVSVFVTKKLAAKNFDIICLFSGDRGTTYYFQLLKKYLMQDLLFVKHYMIYIFYSNFETCSQSEHSILNYKPGQNLFIIIIYC